MVFIDGNAVNAQWPAWSGWATAATEQLSAIPISPASKSKTPSLNPTLIALISNTVPPSTVQWQVSTVSDFSSTVWNSTQSNIYDGERLVVVSTTLTSGTTYFWRVRTGDTAGTTWGTWSAAVEFVPDINAGRAYLDIYENVGREDQPPRRAQQDIFINVGVADKVITVGTDYVFGNVGVMKPSNVPGVEYMFWGDCSGNTPVPHIWFLKPGIGREGDGIEIVCFGAGDLQVTYNGAVDMYRNGVWEPVSVNTWQVFPPTATAYTVDRILDKNTNTIDMQHQIIEITVPAGSVPPGYSLRIRTDGP